MDVSNRELPPNFSRRIMYINMRADNVVPETPIPLWIATSNTKIHNIQIQWTEFDNRAEKDAIWMIFVLRPIFDQIPPLVPPLTVGNWDTLLRPANFNPTIQQTITDVWTVRSGPVALGYIRSNIGGTGQIANSRTLRCKHPQHLYAGDRLSFSLTCSDTGFNGQYTFLIAFEIEKL